jgi:hypothetical protein
MKERHWYLGGFMVFCVVAIALIVYGVAAHQESGFTDARNRWDHLPLTVSCAGHTEADTEACDTAQSVMVTVNSRLGFKMLEWSRHADTDIRVTMRAPVEVGVDEPGGYFELTGSGRVYEHCEVRTMNVSAVDDLEWLVVYHEIGHCLGLAHDDYRMSIMSPQRSPTPARGISAWISDFDRELLRGKYASD